MMMRLNCLVFGILVGVSNIRLTRGSNSTWATASTNLKLSNTKFTQLSLCSWTEISGNSTCLEISNCSTGWIAKECVFTLHSPTSLDLNVTPSVVVPTNSPPTPLAIWSFGLVSVAIISLSGITGAVLWPIIHSPLYGHIITTLVGLATGSLTSTALFQLIPEAFELTEDISPEYLHTSAVALSSVWLLFSLECLSKIVFRKRRFSDKGYVGNGDASLNKVDVPGIVEESLALNSKQVDNFLNGSPGLPTAVAGQTKKKVGTVAWMIIFGDGLHNFIDGMTIGAGYSRSIATGMGLSLAVACEEFPHELGDFAILLQSGMSLKKAMLYNFASACTAFGGLAIGIILGQLEGSHYIFAFAGGLFLYISLTHLIPEMKEAIKLSLRDGRSTPLVLFLLQNLGILSGACIIFMITKYNDVITGFT